MTVKADGSKVIVLRHSRDLSRKALAAATTLSESTIRNIESGKPVDSRSLAKLARFLEVDSTYLLAAPKETSALTAAPLSGSSAVAFHLRRIIHRVWHDPVLASIIATGLVLLGASAWKVIAKKTATSSEQQTFPNNPTALSGEQLRKLLESDPAKLHDLYGRPGKSDLKDLQSQMLRISSPKTGGGPVQSPLAVSGTLTNLRGYVFDELELVLLDYSNTELAVTTVVPSSPSYPFTVSLAFPRPNSRHGLLVARAQGRSQPDGNFHLQNSIGLSFGSATPNHEQEDVKLLQLAPGLPPPTGNPYWGSWALMSDWPRGHSTTDALGAQRLFGDVLPEGAKLPGNARMLLYALVKLGGKADAVSALVREADKLYRQEFPFLFYHYAGYPQPERIMNQPPQWFQAGQSGPNSPPIEEVLRTSHLMDLPTGSGFLKQPIQLAEPYFSRLKSYNVRGARFQATTVTARLMRTAAYIAIGRDADEAPSQLEGAAPQISPEVRARYLQALRRWRVYGALSDC